jgi:hypothetical protein
MLSFCCLRVDDASQCRQTYFILFIKVMRLFSLFRTLHPFLGYMSKKIYAVPPSPPTEIMASEVTSSSVKLTWSRPRQRLQPLQSSAVGDVAASSQLDTELSYIVQYADRTSPPLDGSSDSAEYREITDIGQETEYTVRGLQPHTVYEFRIVAFGSVGRGLPSKPIEVTTSELGKSPAAAAAACCLCMSIQSSADGGFSIPLSSGRFFRFFISGFRS